MLSLYDPDKMPPNFDDALIHQKAAVVGIEKEIDYELVDQTDQEALKQLKLCKCCARKTDKEKFSLNCNLNDLAYLGPGYPLYFDFIKFSGILLFGILLSSGVFNLVTNYYYGKDCKQESEITDKNNECTLDWITVFSLGNKMSQTNLLEYQNYVNFGAIIIMIIIFQFFRKYVRKIDIKCDILDINPMDYSIFISNIPNNYQAIEEDYKKDLKDYLENEVFKGDSIYKVADITLCFDMTKIKQLEKQKQKLLKEKSAIVWYQHKQGYYQPGRTISMINTEIQDLQNQIDHYLNKFYEGKTSEFMKDHFVGQAFISFSDPSVKQEFLDQYSGGSLCNKKPVLTYHNNILQIRSAHDPLNVFWQNLLVKDQRQQSQTLFNISAIKKIALGQFIVTTGCIYALDIILPKLLSSFFDDDSNNYGKTFRAQGLAYNSTIVVIGNTFIPFLVELTDVKQITKKYFQYKTSQKFKRDVPLLKTQDKLNRLFEFPDFTIINRYTLVLKTIYLVSFYSPILPMFLIWGIVSLLLTYWIDKYNLIRRRSVLATMSTELAIEMTEMLEFSLILFTLGNLAAMIYIMDNVEQNTSYQSWPAYGVFLGILHAALPMQWVNDKICSLPENPPNEQTYEEASLTFVTDYARENPATGEISKQMLLKKLDEMKNKALEDQKQQQFQNIKKTNKDRLRRATIVHKTPILSIQEDNTENNSQIGSPSVKNKKHWQDRANLYSLDNQSELLSQGSPNKASEDDFINDEFIEK